ncbi:telomere silencing protein [Pseudozyma hubeiensis SY62]|uniref:Telomere silencing protein n=1 Tax=Pseudozyma hubeiensis (strain SY62) TaxID=1305764 RepID=R9P4V9_PSEHS|nr:telomere silencing protein [Pseudozyma hubeiensis SY62]GAC96324.1 telomere silencing protein [Pseudozyma hubeiensis SY62]
MYRSPRCLNHHDVIVRWEREPMSANHCLSHRATIADLDAVLGLTEMLAATLGFKALSGPCQSLVMPTLRSADEDGTESRRSFRDRPNRPELALSAPPLMGEAPSFMSRMLAETSLRGESMAWYVFDAARISAWEPEALVRVPNGEYAVRTPFLVRIVCEGLSGFRSNRLLDG